MESYALNIGVERNTAFAPDCYSVVKEPPPPPYHHNLHIQEVTGGGWRGEGWAQFSADNPVQLRTCLYERIIHGHRDVRESAAGSMASLVATRVQMGVFRPIGEDNK